MSPSNEQLSSISNHDFWLLVLVLTAIALVWVVATDVPPRS